MHDSAKINAKRFFDTYGPSFPDGAVVVDVGSMDINGSIKDVCPARFNYVGVDFAPGNNVDYVMKDPYRVPVFDGTVDIVTASSVFEHSAMFWFLFNDIMRVLKPNGLFYLNAPSNGAFHRHPIDCWRFYPDAAEALVTWSKHQGQNAAFLESWFSKKGNDGSAWNDFVSVFIADEQHVNQYPNRMAFDIDSEGKRKWKVSSGDIYNGRFHGWESHNILDLQDFPEGKQPPRATA
jgi:SAM-dependent methyltransferase